MKKATIALAILFVTNIYATKYQDTYTTVVEESSELKEKYYKNNYVLHSPAFNKKWTEKSDFTTYEEMLQFISQIATRNKWVTLKYIEATQENRKIPYLILSTNNSKKKVNVWLQGGIHGDEPAGTEGMLALLGEMDQDQEKTKQWLSGMDILMIPRVNVDGTHYFQRRSARNIDFNRDYVKLELPESKLIKRVFNKFSPHVVIDNHEYTVYKAKKNTSLKQFGKNGLAMSYDALYASARNLNIDPEIRSLANNIFIGNMKEDMDKYKFSHEVYMTISNKDNIITLNEAGTLARIGRNGSGLTNTVSILVETRGKGIGKQNFPRRVKTQIVMNESILNTVVANKVQIIDTIDNAIKKTISDGKNGTTDIIIKSKSEAGKKDYVFVEIADNTLVTLNVNYNFSSKEIPTFTRKRPTAYIIPPSFEYVTQKIIDLGLSVSRLKSKKSMNVEAFNILSNKVMNELYEGEFRNIVKTELVKRTITFPKGTAIVSMSQKNANLLALALEPESSDSFATFNIVPVQKGDQFPIFRYMEK